MNGQREAPDLEESAYALALASLPGAGPAGLRSALDQRLPSEAWRAVTEGLICRPVGRRSLPDPSGQLSIVATQQRPGTSQGRATDWRDASRRWDVAGRWRAAQAEGIALTWRGDENYPARLLADPDAPPILSWRGRLSCLEGPTVALVGTRRCTPGGRAVARQMARDLVDAEVCVVSGLALGIDGAAHRGALEADPGGGLTAGVAASGVNVPYPRQHQELWEQVARAGVVLAETAPGHPAQAWRFPARNRIIAGLADLVVVVESFLAGGSLLTVDAALARGVEVCAVPGAVNSPASAGTNRLLLDGAAPVRHAGDVLDTLGIARRPPTSGISARGNVAHRGRMSGTFGAEKLTKNHLGRSGGEPDALSPVEGQVLEAVGWAPTVLGRIVERSGCEVGTVVAALVGLEERKLVIAGSSWWVRHSPD